MLRHINVIHVQRMHSPKYPREFFNDGTAAAWKSEIITGRFALELTHEHEWPAQRVVVAIQIERFRGTQLPRLQRFQKWTFIDNSRRYHRCPRVLAHDDLGWQRASSRER